MHQKHNRWIHFRQIFLCVAETQAIFLLFHMFLWCSFTSNVWSHGINERSQNNSGAKALRILIFLWRSKMQLSVTSSYTRKWISPGLFASLSQDCHYLMSPMKLIKRNSWIQYWKSITISVISKNLSPIYQIVWEKFFSKTPKFTKNVWAYINVLPPRNFAVFNCRYFLRYRLQRAETCTNCVT